MSTKRNNSDVGWSFSAESDYFVTEMAKAAHYTLPSLAHLKKFFGPIHHLNRMTSVNLVRSLGTVKQEKPVEEVNADDKYG